MLYQQEVLANSIKQYPANRIFFSINFRYAEEYKFHRFRDNKPHNATWLKN